MFIKYNTYKSIIKTLSKYPIESGGILGARKNIICRFYADESCIGNNYYIPNIKKLNSVIEYWFKSDILFSGIVHSHPNGFNKLSNEDTKYAVEIIKNNNMKSILFPIVSQNKKKKFKLFIYRITENYQVRRIIPFLIF